MVSSSSAVSTSVSSVKPSCAPCRRASRSGRAPAGTACATSRGEQANPAAWHAPSAQVRAIASTSGRGRVACADAYVPSPLDPTVQAAQAAVALFALVALPTIWWTIVVPTSRKKLATDKRKGRIWLICGATTCAALLCLRLKQLRSASAHASTSRSETSCLGTACLPGACFYHV